MCDFQVVATHIYQGEDEDELSFNKGATIYVVPYEDPEDEASYIIENLSNQDTIGNIIALHLQSIFVPGCLSNQDILLSLLAFLLISTDACMI